MGDKQFEKNDDYAITIDAVQESEFSDKNEPSETAKETTDLFKKKMQDRQKKIRALTPKGMATRQQLTIQQRLTIQNKYGNTN